jgi:hypothetical protein
MIQFASNGKDDKKVAAVLLEMLIFPLCIIIMMMHLVNRNQFFIRKPI